jgi:hypothetical protein
MLGVVGPIYGLERHPRHGLERHVAEWGPVIRRLPRELVVHLEDDTASTGSLNRDELDGGL